jgi:sulfur relay (sulfurtransferase) complex TusBCD TusD component (DsrE family)
MYIKIINVTAVLKVTIIQRKAFVTKIPYIEEQMIQERFRNVPFNEERLQQLAICSYSLLHSLTKQETLTQGVFLTCASQHIGSVEPQQMKRLVQHCLHFIRKVKVLLSLCFNSAPRHEGVLEEYRYSSTHS